MKRRVVVGGTFDIIHVGHIRFLREAKKIAGGGELIVIVARDSTVKRTKGHEPIFNERERLEIVQSLKPVDVAVLGKEDLNIFEILKELKPDVVVLGYDQKISEDLLLEWARKNNLKLEVIRLPKFSSRIDSSSKVREKIIVNMCTTNE